MSEFLPEASPGGPQTDSVGSLLTPATLDISSGDIALMQKVLAAAARNPNLIPSDFMAYIVDYIQTSRLEIPIGQVFGFTQTRVVTGRVNANASIAAGSGFTVSKIGTGQYQITLGTAFADIPVVVATSLAGLGGDPAITEIGAVTSNSFQVATVSHTFVFSDGPFSFLAQPASS